MMLKADADFESKLKVFDYKWLLYKAKTVVTVTYAYPFTT